MAKGIWGGQCTVLCQISFFVVLPAFSDYRWINISRVISSGLMFLCVLFWWLVMSPTIIPWSEVDWRHCVDYYCNNRSRFWYFSLCSLRCRRAMVVDRWIGEWRFDYYFWMVILVCSSMVFGSQILWAEVLRLKLDWICDHLYRELLICLWIINPWFNLFVYTVQF
jgi:hypothetical protein